MSIWDVMNEVRDVGLVLYVVNFIKVAEDMKVEFDLEDLYEIQQRSGNYNEMLLSPKLVVC